MKSENKITEYLNTLEIEAHQILPNNFHAKTLVEEKIKLIKWILDKS